MNSWKEYLWTMVGILSVFLAWQDFVFQKISLLLALAMGGLLFLLSFLSPEFSSTFEWWLFHLGGALLPSLVLFWGVKYKKAGMGDGLVAFFCGWHTGFFHVGWWLLCSLVPAWLHVGIALLKNKANPRIPFVTWMIVGFWLWLGMKRWIFS